MEPRNDVDFWSRLETDFADLDTGSSGDLVGPTGSVPGPVAPITAWLLCDLPIEV